MKQANTSLTPEQAIAEVLKRYPAVRPTPVRNVAYWPSGNNLHNSLNLTADARAYGWKGKQLAAIKLVLKLQGKL